jgi:hypothetical protein
MKINGCEKLLAPKLDTLWKHGGSCKANVDIPGVVKKGEFFTTLDCAHLKNEVLFLAIGRDMVVEQIAAGGYSGAQEEAGPVCLGIYFAT